MTPQQTQAVDERLNQTCQRPGRCGGRATSPYLHHRLLRCLGVQLFGVKGVDWMLRHAHSPDQRQQWHLQTEVNALWGGPKFHLETNWYTEWQTYFYGTQDRAIHRWLKNNVQADWTCLDVGMNFGFFACLCAQLCRDVHGFEPISVLFRRAQRNCALNGLINIHLNQLALSDRQGVVSFHLPNAESSNWGTGSLVHDQHGEAIEVTSTTLDSYCQARKLSRLDFMKIDVEGAEHLVLRGGMEVLGRFRPAIIFENNSDSRDSAFLILQDFGYSFYDLSGSILVRSAGVGHLPSDILALPERL